MFVIRIIYSILGFKFVICHRGNQFTKQHESSQCEWQKEAHITRASSPFIRTGRRGGARQGLAAVAPSGPAAGTTASSATREAALACEQPQ